MFTYNADLQVESEMIDVQGGTTFDRLITRRYKDGSADGIPGQIWAVEVGDSGDPDADYKVEYFHEPLAAGRVTRVTGPGLPAYGAQYSYECVRNGNGARFPVMRAVRHDLGPARRGLARVCVSRQASA